MMDRNPFAIALAKVLDVRGMVALILSSSHWQSGFSVGILGNDN